MTLKSFAALPALAALAAAPLSHAQVTDASMGKMVPVDLFVCSYREGKTRTDLDVVISNMTAFLDVEKIDTYAAWLLTPYFYGAGQDFDLIWMAANTNGETMGEATHTYLSKGGALIAGFDDVLDCPAHVGLASAMYKAPLQNQTPGTSIMSMSDCSMNEGTRYADVRAAEIKWAAIAEESGSKAGIWHWFPTFGGGDQNYDYKLLNVYPDMRELGKSWEWMANGGGRDQSSDVFGDLDECDDARVYIATSLRSAQLR